MNAVVKIAPAIEGRVDAVEGTVIHGWVWDRTRPAVRLEVAIAVDGEPKGTVVADRLRPDLAANGIGDGAHAFMLEVGDARPDGEVTATVALPGGGQVVLGHADPGEAVARAAVVEPLRRLADLVTAMAVSSRDFRSAQQSALKDIKVSFDEHLVGAVNGLAAAAGAAERIAEAQEALARQVAALEVFHIRLDATLGTLAGEVEGLRRAAGTGGPLPVAMVAGGTAAVVLVAMGLTLLLAL